MINEVRDAFLSNMRTLSWMDNETREAAIKKANAITDMIGEIFIIIYNSKTTYQLIIPSINKVDKYL